MDKVNFFKDCLPQISFRPFLNTLSHLEFYQTSMMEELKNYRAFFVTFILFKRNFFNICVLSQIWCIEYILNTHHSFSCYLRLLYELKHKFCLCKIACGISHFQFCFVFIKVYIFVQQNAYTL